LGAEEADSAALIEGFVAKRSPLNEACAAGAAIPLPCEVSLGKRPQGRDGHALWNVLACDVSRETLIRLTAVSPKAGFCGQGVPATMFGELSQAEIVGKEWDANWR